RYNINNTRISSTGGLLAFSNNSTLHVHDLRTGLVIMVKESIFVRDFQFVDNGRHLLVINSDKENMHIIATLYDPRSGTELASVILPQNDIAYPRHLQIIDDRRIVAVIPYSEMPGQNVLLVEEWNWEKAFRKQLNGCSNII